MEKAAAGTAAAAGPSASEKRAAAATSGRVEPATATGKAAAWIAARVSGRRRTGSQTADRSWPSWSGKLAAASIAVGTVAELAGLWPLAAGPQQVAAAAAWAVPAARAEQAAAVGTAAALAAWAVAAAASIGCLFSNFEYSFIAIRRTSILLHYLCYGLTIDRQDK